MADISKITLPDGSTYNLKDATARGYVTGVKGNTESSYRTGQVNITPANVGAIAKSESGNTQQLVRPLQLNGLNDNTVQTLVNTTRANRLAFLPADQIIIEKTTDGGSTWVSAGISDATKVGLFSETRAGVSIPLLYGVKNVNCGLRITITAMKYDVPDGTAETSKYNYWNSNYVLSTERYCQLKEMYFWVNSNSDGISLKVERATGAASTTWYTIYNSGSTFALKGWSGCDYIRFAQGVFGGGTNQTGNYWNYRLTFFTRNTSGGTTLSTSYTTSTQSIMEIRAYGDTWWTSANEYMANDKMYTHDYLKNVTFPAKVTASGGFAGALTGNVTGNVTGDVTGDVTGNVSGTASNVTGTVALANGGTGATSASAACTNLGAVNTAGTGLSKSGTTLNHSNSVTASTAGTSSATSGTNTLAVPYVAYDAQGHVTASGTHTHTIGNASTSAYGVTKLSTSTSSTSTTLAATPSAVKTAYDLANSANTTANTTLSGLNGTLIYDHTYSISNGVATFTPHVYLKGEEVTTNYAKSCFGWKYRLINGSEVTLTTKSDRGCDVTITNMGYGGHVIGTFTPA